MSKRSWCPPAAPAALRRVLTILFLSTLTVVTTTSAQSFKVVQAFAPTPQIPSGKLLEVADGLFYAVSRAGGEFSKGAVFILYRRADSTWATVTIHSFNGTDGANPSAGLIIGRDGNFYGTTLTGGAADDGTVFRMTWFGALTTLHSFSGGDGAFPRAALVQGADGAFYGTASSGGAHDNPGTVFKLTSNGNFTLLHSFDGTDGYSPNGLVQGADGDFYGTTSVGGIPNNAGTVFKVTASGVVTVLHDFQSDDSWHPRSLIQGSDGDFYGTTSPSACCVASNAGAVFRMTRAGSLTFLHHFTATDGANPEAGLVEAPDHNFYGTTTSGLDESAMFGTAYRVNSAGNFATVSYFGGSLGSSPSELTLTRAGMLVGTTQFGGVPTTPTGPTGGFGTVFSMATSGSATLLYSFSGVSPVEPLGGLVEVSGVLYGTSCRGGIFDRGTIFRLNSGGVTTLYSFTGGDDGACPVSGLLAGTDGMLYGTTFLGGVASGGTIFKVTQTGELTVLHEFPVPLSPGTGAGPVGGLAWGPDGNLYGTTSDFLGGAEGTAFRITTNGALNVLHEFGSADGATPLGTLVLATDGNFYGTTVIGPDASTGGIFRLLPNGSLSSLHAFTQERAVPVAGLTQARDGNLYGTAAGGTFGAGLLFKSTLSGSVSVLHEFSSSDGSAPLGPLLEASNGVLYGTTSRGGGADAGTVFQLGSDGSVTTMHTFIGLDGASPYAGLLQASDGALYGTTASAGPGRGGVVFRIVP